MAALSLRAAIYT